MKTLWIVIMGFIPSLLFAQSSKFTPFIQSNQNGVSYVEYIDSSTIRHVRTAVLAFYRRMWIDDATHSVLHAQSIGLLVDCRDSSMVVVFGRDYNAQGQLVDSIEVTDIRTAVWTKIQSNSISSHRSEMLCGKPA